MTKRNLPAVAIGQGDVQVSAIGLGCMGLSGTWNPSEMTPDLAAKAFLALETAVDAGITLFDHADIYGRTTCESIFGEFLSNHPGLRERLFLATKCGIVFEDEQGPYRYNLSAVYIEKSVAASLKRLRTDYLDLFQLHRPDPLAHPKETASALNKLVREKVVRQIGVSNYHPSQLQALQAYLEVPVVTSQPSISLWNLETLHNGVLDQCLEMNIRPLAYSPLAGGLLSGKRTLAPDDPELPRFRALQDALETMCSKYNATPGQLSLAWLMHHPAQIIPLVGSIRPEHIREAVEACHISMTREDWYTLWTEARGERLP